MLEVAEGLGQGVVDGTCLRRIVMFLGASSKLQALSMVEEAMTLKLKNTN